jgi:uncharacterized membrane protein
MKWSIGLMLIGTVFFALGILALWFGKFSLSSAETAASFIATGVLIFLVGLLLRRVTKSFD